MKNIPLILLLFLCSCSNFYVQLFHAEAIGPIATQNETYFFENDTIRVTYNFWAEHGIMNFTIYNKLNVPLYVDWRKSAFIQNNEKQDYWQDVETINSKTVSRTSNVSADVFVPGVSTVQNGQVVTTGTEYNVGNGKGVTYGSAVKTKPERISFIAPHTQIQKAQFSLYLVSAVKLNEKETKIYSAANTYKSDTSKKEYIAYKNYTNTQAPLQFRNFLTFSTNEDFKNEFYVDNGFYINRIAVMTKNQFCGKPVSHNGIAPADGAAFEYPYQDARLFYINMSAEGNDYCAPLFGRKPLNEVMAGTWQK